MGWWTGSTGRKGFAGTISAGAHCKRFRIADAIRPVRGALPLALPGILSARRRSGAGERGVQAVGTGVAADLPGGDPPIVQGAGHDGLPASGSGDQRGARPTAAQATGAVIPSDAVLAQPLGIGDPAQPSVPESPD